jgi:hypothetical protein
MSKIVQKRANAHSAAIGGEFFRLGVGTKTRRDRAAAQISSDEDRVAPSEARQGAESRHLPAGARHPTSAARYDIQGAHKPVGTIRR